MRDVGGVADKASLIVGDAGWGVETGIQDDVVHIVKVGLIYDGFNLQRYKGENKKLREILHMIPILFYYLSHFVVIRHSSFDQHSRFEKRMIYIPIIFYFLDNGLC